MRYVSTRGAAPALDSRAITIAGLVGGFLIGGPSGLAIVAILIVLEVSLSFDNAVVNATILTPTEFTGTIMELCQGKRGQLGGMDYLSEDRVEMRYTLPLAEIVFDFFDQLKSRTRGYASLDYQEAGDQAADLVKVDILLQGETVDAFSAIVHKDKAYAYGVMMAGKLKELIPRQQFEVPIQAAVGSRIIARETLSALRKDGVIVLEGKRHVTVPDFDRITSDRVVAPFGR